MNIKDTYLTIKNPSEETLFKDRNSKFFGYAFPVTNEKEVKRVLENLRTKHSNAGHFCYAYQLGIDQIEYRVNDDGEPNNSAGIPIYGQIQSFGITNVLIVSVRYFGGVKLGVGGLINAYKTSAKMALQASEIIENIVTVSIQLNFEYDVMNKVMRIIKEKNLDIVSQKMELNCELIVSCRRGEVENITSLFHSLYPLEVTLLKT